MLIRSTTRRQEKREENAASLLVSPTVVAQLVRRLEDRMTMLDLAGSVDASAIALVPQPGRAD
jgi:hypothetical protein